MSQQTQPHLLIIMLDQLRYDCLGSSAMRSVHTPHLDQLAAEGARFTSAYTPIPVCSPARQAFLHGTRPEAFGALWNYDLSSNVSALSPQSYTWSKQLQQAGYRSAFLGKWHINPDHGPAAYGYDTFIDLAAYEQTVVKPHYSGVTYPNGWFGDANPIPLEHSRTHWLADQTADTIRAFSEHDQPWHIRVDFSEPHLPCRPSAPFDDMYDPNLIPPWGSFSDTLDNKPYIQRQQLMNWGIESFTWGDWAPVVARYYGMISQVDDAVGRILDALEPDVRSNTVVILSADHGDMCGGHRMMDKHYVLYDDVVHVPLIIRWPARIPAGQVREQFVCNMLDLPPTLLDWCELPKPDHLQGHSLTAILEHDSTEEIRDEAIASFNGQQFGLYSQRMIRTREWKYIWNATDVDELYDLQQDPHECVNRIDDPLCATRLSELRTRLHQELVQDGDRLLANPWLRDQLLNNRKYGHSQ